MHGRSLRMDSASLCLMGSLPWAGGALRAADDVPMAGATRCGCLGSRGFKVQRNNAVADGSQPGFQYGHQHMPEGRQVVPGSELKSVCF